MAHSKRLLLILLVSLLATEWSVAASPRVPEELGKLMKDRQYTEAIALIDKLDKDQQVDQDYLLYLKGRAFHYLKKYDEAVDVFEALNKTFPDSQWARRARFAKGLSFARRGDYQAAEESYRAEATYLLSLDRKQEIADIYLEFATTFFAPEDKEKKPDYKKSLVFYQNALAIGPKPEQQRIIELRIAVCYQKLEKYQEAGKRFLAFISAHKGHELEIEARFQLGECQYASKKLVDARRTWKDLLALHEDANSPRIAEAAYRISLTHNMPMAHSSTQQSQGVAVLRTFIKRFPRHELASEAHLKIAQSYQFFGRHEDALETLQQFLNNQRYAESKEIPTARYLLGNSYNLQQKFDEAIKVWRDFLVQHPTHKYWSTVQQEIINTEHFKALTLLQEKKYAPARQLWEKFLSDHPLDLRNPDILYYFGLMQYKQKQWDDALGDWRQLVSKYPDSSQAAHAQFMIAATLEEKLAKLDQALQEYRKVKESDFQSHARRRINRLTRKHLSIATERTFRSGEAPRLKLLSRNIEEVNVRLYTVDMETYFRKMHSTTGIGQLDISLINPDHEFTFKVPDYEQYRQANNQLEVPLPKMGNAQAPPAGVMAVTVSSKTLEATSLILQSDLDIIIKSSRDEIFVFAENMRSGEAWPKVRLLISDGKQVLHEGVTDENGVYQAAISELKAIKNVRVFAVAEGHIASNIVNFKGLKVARGLSDRGYIFTERPAYRPGQMVHLRGIIRKVSGDLYTIDQEKKYQVDVFNTNNRLIHETKVALNAYGSFHVNFLVPPASPQGQYRIVVHDDDRESYTGTFLVHEFQLEPVQVEVDVPRTIYYRGEEIVGTIRATFYYGAPLVDKEVRYQLAGGRIITAKTDKKGEIPFKLATREFRESQALVLNVGLPEHNLQASKNFFLATQGFSLTASSVRDVYLTGETFELSVSAVDAEGKPIERELTLQVLKQTTVGNRMGEVLVEKHPLKTDKDGQARQTLRIEKGGPYILRVEGEDRFQNPVTDEIEVQVSDQDDAIRLRILADRHTFKEGEVANVVLHWREKPALALVTFEGSRILKYQLVHLQTGANKLAVPISHQLAPTFELAVAVMTNRSVPEQPPADDDDAQATRLFHSAISPFTVERQLNVKIAIQRPAGDNTLTPGQPVPVTITTTDPQGNPVSAEVSLAMIENSLLSRFPATLEKISDFFRGSPRRWAVRTASSVEFSYRPVTKPINAQLLAEADRRELEAEEKRLLVAGEVRNNRALRPIDVDEGADLFADSVSDPAFDALHATIDGQSGFSSNLLFGMDGGMSGGMGGAMGGGMGGGNFGGRFAGGFGGGGANLKDESSTPDQLLAEKGLDPFGSQPNTSAATTPQLSGNGNSLDEMSATLSLVISQSQEIAAEHYGYQAIDPRLALKSRFAGRGPLAGKNRREVQVLQPDGTSWFLTLKGRSDKELAAAVDQLAQAGAVLLPHLSAQETGYWNPSITTNEKGQANVTVTLPERTTAWTLRAKGITLNTMAGQAEEEVIVKKDLFGQLKLPMAFTDGDQANVGVTVHNDALDAGEIEVTLRTTIGDKSSVEKKVLTVKSRGVHELNFLKDFKLPVQDIKQGVPGAKAVFALTVRAGERNDTVERTVPIQPDGMLVYSIATGSTASSITAFIDPPAGIAPASQQLQVIIGPTVEQSLLDVLLAPPTWCQSVSGKLASGADSAVSDLMAALALQQLLGATRDAESPHTQSLDTRIRSSISLLVTVQGNNGGWSWAGQHGGSDRYASARVMWGLSLAKSAGYRVADDTFSRAITFLQTQLGKARVNDYETKALLLHALVTAGKADFPLANQLYRNRQSLSETALAHLSLAFAGMDRKQTAAELLTLLNQKNPAGAGPQGKNKPAHLTWTQSPVELQALHALALDQITPADGRLQSQINWLMAHRTGHRWAPDKATGPAMLATCRWFARTRFQGERYKLTVFVNDQQAVEMEIDDQSQTQTFDIPTRMLDKEKQRVRFQLTGRGRYTYQCVLGGFASSNNIKSSTNRWKVTRYYQPSAVEMDGQAIPRGFGILAGSYTSFRNVLNQLPVARRGHVQLKIDRDYRALQEAPEQSEYLVVTEPLPAGARVVENSIKGGFERYEISPGAITFYVGSRRSVETIRYDIHGYLAGNYRATPTLVRNAYRPDQIAVGKVKQLAILPLGAKSEDAYKLTPTELYELGKRHFEKDEFKEAAGHLQQLMSEWTLAAKYYKETVRMLLHIHLKEGPAQDVVRYFEIIVEKYPDLEIPFDKLIQVAAAYHKIAEYERSYLVYRAMVEASFMRESQVAGFLREQNEFLRSVQVMEQLLHEYPPEPYLATATYALAQEVYAKAPAAAKDSKLRKEKINRVTLIQRALEMLDQFLTALPEDPAADQASFSLANALLDLEKYEQATASSQRYATRYPKSDFLDSYWYIIGYCHFARGQHEQALEMCNKVAEAKRTDRRSGREVESPNKWRAIYIVGQIYHSLGKAEDAIKHYTRVQDRFADARQAILYFARKQINLPEVTVIKPQENATIELKFRNLATCNATVYRIDLMKFSLLRRNLSGIININLAGIRPFHEASIPLGDGKDYRDRSIQLTLPVKEEGAYLVVCRGENLHTSGLVLVTPLALEVQEDATSGRVRTTVRNTVDKRYVTDVHVKVIGTRNPDFSSGETDLRGVFVADAIKGKSMVIAQAKGNRYAFFRGTADLGPKPASPKKSEAGKKVPQDVKRGKNPTKEDLLEGLQQDNRGIQMEQQKQLEGFYRNGIQKGIGGGFGGGIF